MDSGATITNVFGLTTPDLLSASTYAGTNTSSAGAVVTVNSVGGLSTGPGTDISFGSGWNIGTDPTGNTWVILDGQTRPMLGMEYSTTITNAHQLQLIGLNSTTLGASYTLANNIDLSGVTNASEVWGTSFSVDGSGGAGFAPMGSAFNGFTGTLNGQGHLIDHLYVNLAGDFSAGLFDQIGAGTVENLGLTNVQIIGSGDNFTGGGLAGDSSGTITNVSTTGTVSGSSGLSSSFQVLGGLVGINDGTISSSSSTVTVGAGSDRFTAGGLVGLNGDGSISNSFSTGDGQWRNQRLRRGAAWWGFWRAARLVIRPSTGSVSGNNRVGGLVGEVSAIEDVMISDSFSSATVTGTAGSTAVGGLVGFNNAPGPIEGSYSTGTVTVGAGSSDVGGLVRGERLARSAPATAR